MKLRQDNKCFTYWLFIWKAVVNKFRLNTGRNLRISLFHTYSADLSNISLYVHLSSSLSVKTWVFYKWVILEFIFRGKQRNKSSNNVTTIQGFLLSLESWKLRANIFFFLSWCRLLVSNPWCRRSSTKEKAWRALLLPMLLSMLPKTVLPSSSPSLLLSMLPLLSLLSLLSLLPLLLPLLPLQEVSRSLLAFLGQKDALSIQGLSCG